jgi:hypothetical protein
MQQVMSSETVSIWVMKDPLVLLSSLAAEHSENSHG